MSGVSLPIVVWSRKHEPSIKLLEQIKFFEKTSKFTYLCIEDVPRNQIPHGVERVPTIVCPDGKQLVGYTEIMPFLAQCVSNRDPVPNTEIPASMMAPAVELGPASAPTVGGLFESSGEQPAMPLANLEGKLTEEETRARMNVLMSQYGTGPKRT